MDTYEPFGGNPLFEKARDIASRALISEWPRGWKERLKRLDEIVALRDYRMFKYHFWHIMDLVNQEKHKQISEAISKALESLEKMPAYLLWFEQELFCTHNSQGYPQQ